MAGRRLPKKPKVDAVRNDINVTPLVDVVLVLLIIFMVIAPMMARGRDIADLPKTKFHSQEKDQQQPVVALDADGNIWFDKEMLSDKGAAKKLTPGVEKDLRDRIQRAWDTSQVEAGKGRVFVKASSQLPYNQVYPLIIALKDMPNVSFDIATAEELK